MWSLVLNIFSMPLHKQATLFGPFNVGTNILLYNRFRRRILLALQEGLPLRDHMVSPSFSRIRVTQYLIFYIFVFARDCFFLLAMVLSEPWFFYFIFYYITFFSWYLMAILRRAKRSLEPSPASVPSLNTASTSCVPLHRSINSQAKSIHFTTRPWYSF